MNMNDFFEKGVARFPDRDAVRHGDRSWTFRELDALVGRIATALLDSGLDAGDRVAIYAPNGIWTYACQYAIHRAGMVWVPINYRNTGADAIASLDKLEINWLFLGEAQAEGLEGARERLPSLRGMIHFGAGEGGIEDWLARERAPRTFPPREAADTAMIASSSGTTGAPKGIVLSNRSVAAALNHLRIVSEITRPPVHLVVAPLSHSAGLYAAALMPAGGTSVFIDKTDPLSIMKAIQDEGITTLFLPPTLIYMMIAHPEAGEFDFSSLDLIVYGAAPMSASKLAEAARLFGHKLAQGYAQFEAPMGCTYLSTQDHREALENPGLVHRLRSAGREGALVRLEIMGDDGEIMGPNERGEIVVRGEIVMDGYYKDEAATAATRRNGWHLTGDVGYKDEDGFVYIVDRKKEMIVSGGFNIYPAEVEQTAMAHPAIRDCAIIGVPDDKWGEAVMAVVELREGVEFDADSFIAFCKERVGSMKAPKSVVVHDNMPRSAVGKVLKRTLRDQYWEGRERAI